MDIKIARNLVKDTFENDFDKNRFYYFIKNLLNEIEEQDKDRFIYRGNFIPDAYKPYIKTLERIGKYQDSKRNKIDLLIVQLKKETSLEHARTMQRNFIAWYLNGSRGDVLKDAALVAFVSPNQDDWRFSLVRMDYKIVDSGKVKQELTPAKRFSFLVGENEASHTAQSKLAPLIEDDNNNPTLDQLEEVFNIEKVTKEFFEKYRELFLWVKEELEKLLKKDEKIKKDFEQKSVNTVDFAKKLLGQIVFLYFLQKKGWFGVQRDEDWGTGPKDFLRRLFEKQIADYKNFFNEILEPLFYEALARERDDNFYSRFDCKIPFLNGGLFDPLNDYDWVHTDINLPDELFSNLLKTKEGDTGTGILDIFDRFNFTVKEDEPLDKEVAVDPEMLGKVFENLLEVKDRKSKGTYYTPREIVHYMCQQSLINYLATELNSSSDGGRMDSSEVELVSKKDIETLIQLGETAIEHDSHISDNGKETPTYSYKLPESVRKNARLIDEKLASIKVCDPAIGSGAFPVGMMNIIVKTRSVLNSYIKEEKDRSTYDFKRHAIANSLYGVDIDLGAVEIAKLRLWLSLIVDEQDIKKIKPLPNLDYKIMQGNSLIELLSPDLVRKGSDQEKNKLIDQLSGLKNQYFEATSRKVKLKLRDQINELIIFIANYDKAKELEHSKNLLANLKAQKSLFSLGPENLTLGEVESKEVKKLKKKVQELKNIKDASPEDHFEWHLNFNEIFEENDGFDVVIGNPPWLSNDNLSKQEKELFRKIYEVAKSRFDIACLFAEKGSKILHEKGILFFVMPEHIWLGDYFIPFRKFLATKVSVLEILSSKEGSFEQVSNPSSAFLLQKFPPDSEKQKVFLGSFLSGDTPKTFLANINIAERVIFDKFTQKLVKKIKKLNFSNLGDIALVTDGIQTANLLKTIFTQDPKTNTKYHKALRSGKAIRFRYAPVKWDGWWVLKPFFTRKYRRPGFSYDSPKRIKCFSASEKIILRQTEPTIFATIDVDNYFFPNSIFQIALEQENPEKLRWLLGLLNSRFLRFLYLKLSQVEGTTKPQIYINLLKSLSIPEGTNKNISERVSGILKITKINNYSEDAAMRAKVTEYQKQIDSIVYKIYNLTPKEIKIVEKNTK
jgi:hypothetical protein